MPNHLIDSISPYLLQHADNPVDWYPWGDLALEKAQREDKPIFLSIGYAACHWCHVMAHESFEDPEIARLLNENFVNIKVDREERPDLDAIYMSAVIAMTGQGGWPMSLFLTPSGVPFFAGTYFPSQPRYGMPSFRQILEGVSQLWQQEREQIYESGKEISASLIRNMQWQVDRQPLNPDVLQTAAKQLLDTYDHSYGGWGPAPKFPQPMVLDFLLRRASRGDRQALDTALHTLHQMSKGGMYDVIGGGFHRYSTDHHWLVPHFEKMLYDNAQLARVYLHAFQVTGDSAFKRICTATLDAILRDFSDSNAGFFSSLDADTQAGEGKYYVWTPDEIRSVLANPSDSNLFLAAYGVSDPGNFDEANILQRVMNDAALADQFGLPPSEIPTRLANMSQKLLAVRKKRPSPAVDDKVLTGWNALAIRAFAEAGLVLGDSKYISAAMRSADFLLARLHPQDRLLHSWRRGQVSQDAFLDDIASFSLALFSLYQTDPDVRWYQAAVDLVMEMIQHYSDPAGGFFDTRSDQPPLIVRPKEIQDNAIPSGNALAAEALLVLAAYTGDQHFRQIAENLLSTLQGFVVRYPTSFGYWLNVLDFAIHPGKQVAIIGSLTDDRTLALKATLYHHYFPGLVAAISDFPPPSGSPPLLFDRPLVNQQPTAYVCQDFVCNLPVNDPGELERQLTA